MQIFIEQLFSSGASTFAQTSRPAILPLDRFSASIGPYYSSVSTSYLSILCCCTFLSILSFFSPSLPLSLSLTLFHSIQLPRLHFLFLKFRPNFSTTNITRYLLKSKTKSIQRVDRRVWEKLYNNPEQRIFRCSVYNVFSLPSLFVDDFGWSLFILTLSVFLSFFLFLILLVLILRYHFNSIYILTLILPSRQLLNPTFTVCARIFREKGDDFWSKTKSFRYCWQISSLPSFYYKKVIRMAFFSLLADLTMRW